MQTSVRAVPFLRPHARYRPARTAPRLRRHCRRTPGVRSAGLSRAEPRPRRHQGRPDRRRLGRPDRLGFDADEPHQRGAKGGPGHRRGAARHPDRCAQGHPPRLPGNDAAVRGCPPHADRSRTAAAPPARPSRHCRAPLRQHERRSGAGVFFGRHQRGHHHRVVEAALVLRDRAQLVLHLQRQGRPHQADRRGARRRLRGRGQRAQEWATACASPPSSTT